MKKYLGKFLSLALAAAMLFCVCGGAIAADGPLTVIMAAEPYGLEPGSNVHMNLNTVVCQVYDTLVMQKWGSASEIAPMLAESWTIENDGKRIVFKIKDGVKFHNGDPLTVEDVVFSLRTAMERPTTKNLSESFESVEKVDDSHVALNLKYAFGPIFNILVNPSFSIMNEKWVKDLQARGGNIQREACGTGAFKFVQWNSGDSIIFEANPDYHMGKPNFSGVVVKVMTDPTTASLAIENGEADVFIGMSGADRDRLIANPETDVLDAFSNAHYYIAFRADQEPWNNKTLRQAVAHCINKEDIKQPYWEGRAVDTVMPITPDFFGYDEKFPATPYDLEKAKALLKEAGAEGMHCVLTTSREEWYSLPAQVIQEQMRKLGLDCEIKIMERGAYDDEVNGQRKFEVTYFATSGEYPDADATISRRFTPILGQHSNLVGEMDQSVYDLVKKARESSDPAERKALYRQICEINRDEAWYIPIITGNNSITIRSNLNAYPHSGGFYHFYEWSRK